MHLSLAKWITLISLCLSMGCSTANTLKELTEQYTTYRGKVVAPPTVEPHRVFLYIELEPEEGETQGRVIVAVAENKEKSEILVRLAERVLESDKPIFLLGEKVKGPWREYAEGIDFEVFAAGYYNPKGKKYQTIITTYGDRVTDVISSISWGEFVKMVGKKAVDAAM